MFTSRPVSVPSEFERYNALPAIGLRACLPVREMSRRLPSFGKRYSLRASGAFATRVEIIDNRYSRIIAVRTGIDAQAMAQRYVDRLNAKAN